MVYTLRLRNFAGAANAPDFPGCILCMLSTSVLFIPTADAEFMTTERGTNIKTCSCRGVFMVQYQLVLGTFMELLPLLITDSVR